MDTEHLKTAVWPADVNWRLDDLGIFFIEEVVSEWPANLLFTWWNVCAIWSRELGGLALLVPALVLVADDVGDQFATVVYVAVDYGATAARLANGQVHMFLKSLMGAELILWQVIVGFGEPSARPQDSLTRESV